MNPKGLKPTITSRFVKPPEQIEFLSHEMLLHRSPKPYEKNIVSFRCSPYLSKPEIKQYLSKVYNLPIQNVDTANKMGEINPKRDWNLGDRIVDDDSMKLTFQKSITEMVNRDKTKPLTGLRASAFSSRKDPKCGLT